MSKFIEGKSIMDYIIDQAERYDGLNLEYEHRISHAIMDIYDRMIDRISKIVQIYGRFSTTLQYEQLCNKIQMQSDVAYSDAYKILVSAVQDYMEKGYDNFGDLIDMANELQDKLENEKVSELKNTMVDTHAIDYMRNHAFEYVKNISDKMMMDMRTQLGGLLVTGNITTKDIANMVQSILNSTRYRAETIAQTELSMAYNSGALARMEEYNAIAMQPIEKYWHGFKYSESTCSYCRPKIGTIYPIDDNSVVLPAHPRCRCVWLPYLPEWGNPISGTFTRRANMVNRVYSIDQIYARINKRLGINYADYLTNSDATRYINGDRGESMMDAIGVARGKAIQDTKTSFDISTADMEQKMSGEFKTQMNFWKKYVAQSIVDNDTDLLDKSYEAIQGVMILPWSADQMRKWKLLLDIIKDNI